MLAVAHHRSDSKVGDGVIEKLENGFCCVWRKRWVRIKEGELQLYKTWLRPNPEEDANRKYVTQDAMYPYVTMPMTEGSTTVAVATTFSNRRLRREYAFEIITEGKAGLKKTHAFSCKNKKDRDAWMEHAKKCVISTEETIVPGTIFRAAQRGDIKGLRQKLSEGVDLNEKNIYSMTPLHYAVTAACDAYAKGHPYEQHFFMITCLVDWEANLYMKNLQKNTPIDLAKVCKPVHRHLSGAIQVMKQRKKDAKEFEEREKRRKGDKYKPPAEKTAVAVWMTDERFIEKSTKEIGPVEADADSAGGLDNRDGSSSSSRAIAGAEVEENILSSALATLEGAAAAKFVLPKDHNGIDIPYATSNTLEAPTGAIVSFDEQPDMVRALSTLQLHNLDQLAKQDRDDSDEEQEGRDEVDLDHAQRYMTKNPDAMLTDDFISNLTTRGERLTALEETRLRETVDPYNTGFMHFNGMISEILHGRKKKIKVGKVYIE